MKASLRMSDGISHLKTVVPIGKKRTAAAPHLVGLHVWVLFRATCADNCRLYSVRGEASSCLSEAL